MVFRVGYEADTVDLCSDFSDDSDGPSGTCKASRLLIAFG